MTATLADERTAQEHTVAGPGRLLLTLVLGCAYVIGYVPGALLTGLCDCLVAVMLGYRAGRAAAMAIRR